MIVIDKYDMSIYPLRLWVATGWDESIPGRFVCSDGSEIENAEDRYAATTYDVKERRTGRYGVLIVFRELDDDLGGSVLVSYVAHESLHATSFVSQALGIKADWLNDEPLAYMIGWISGCCWKTLQKVIYKNEKK